MARGISVTLTLLLTAIGLLLLPGRSGAQEPLKLDRYHTPEEAATLLREFAGRHPQLASVREIGKSAGGSALYVMRLAASSPQSLDLETRPAILVCANIEGKHLIGTEAALLIIERLLAGYATDAKVRNLLEQRTVFVAPLLNPDAARSYFGAPRLERAANDARIDQDVDGAAGEDGPEDLNHDGLITMMRVRDPEGEYIADPKEPRLMRRADPKKGEAGIYKLYTEGIDNDGDGNYNEDAPGGVELNRNFAHDFENNSIAAGRWPVSQPETIALAEFMSAHRNIALVLNFSTENTILKFDQGGSGGAGDGGPEAPASAGGRRGGRGGAPEGATRVIRANLPATTIDAEDKPIFETVQQDFREALKAAKLEYPEKKARPAGKGSLAAWCYFQYGVPVFSDDLWAVPEVKKEGAEEKTSQTQALTPQATPSAAANRNPNGNGFGKKSGRGTSVIGGRKGGADGTAAPPVASGELPDADLLQWSDKGLNGKGFVPWKAFKHPTLGEVEIGGFAPFARTLPPPDRMEQPVRFAADFYLKLMQRTAGLAIKETRVEALDGALYNITCYLTNSGVFPTSTAQGRRARTSWPITVQLTLGPEEKLFSGQPIEKIPVIAGGGGVQKLEWTVRAARGSVVEIRASSPKLGTVTKQVTLQERGQAQ